MKSVNSQHPSLSQMPLRASQQHFKNSSPFELPVHERSHTSNPSLVGSQSISISKPLPHPSFYGKPPHSSSHTPNSNTSQLSTSYVQSTQLQRDEPSHQSRQMLNLKERKQSSNALSISYSNEEQLRILDSDGMDELVMSRTDWFSCLKAGYAQLESFTQQEQEHLSNPVRNFGVDKSQLIQLIQLNMNQLPLLSLKEYIGGSTVRKEKWISVSQVIESLRKIDTTKDLSLKLRENLTQKGTQNEGLDCFEMVHWDDIIDSLMITTLTPNNNNKSLQLDSNNISEIYSSETAIVGAGMLNSNNTSLIFKHSQSKGDHEESSLIHQLRSDKQITFLQERQQPEVDFTDYILQHGKKLVLKDNSILVDLSRIGVNHCTQSIQELLSHLITREQQLGVKGMSLASLDLNQTLNPKMNCQGYLNISNMNSLVILNLSRTGGMDLNRELSKVNLLNLQFLNISQNGLKELSLSNHNFPKLKEIYASGNLFQNGKSFSKLDSIKLLDLENNSITNYDEIVCLAFLQNLVVLSLLGNPIQGLPDFQNNAAKLFPKIAILNPDSIKKVSCFENFKELAFGGGKKGILNESQSSSASENIPQRTININIEQSIAQQENQKQRRDTTQSISMLSTPSKSQIQAQQQKKMYLRGGNEILEQIQNSNTKLPQQMASNKCNQQVPSQNQSAMMQAQEEQKERHPIQKQQNEHYESQNLQSKLISTQIIPVKNDSLKYFNQLSRKGTDSETKRHRGHLYNASLQSDQPIVSRLSQIPTQTYCENDISKKSEVMTTEKSDPDEFINCQKPPRCIKIRGQNQNGQNGLTQERGKNNSYSGAQVQSSMRSLPIDQQSMSNNTDLLETPKVHKMYEQKSQINPFQPISNSDLYGCDARQDTESQFSNTGGLDVARYYERSISSMNIHKIREMPSKEICKVNDNQIKRNMSPINAMMILQPPKENKGTPIHKGGNIQSTPQQLRVNLQQSSAKRQSLSNNRSRQKTPKSGIQNNRTTESFGKSHQKNSHSQNKKDHKSDSLNPRSMSEIQKNSRNKKVISSQNPSANRDKSPSIFKLSYEIQTKMGMHSRRSSQENDSFLNTQKTQKLNDNNMTLGEKISYPVTNRGSQFQTPFNNYVNNVSEAQAQNSFINQDTDQSDRDSIRPFRLPPRESPSLYKRNSQPKDISASPFTLLNNDLQSSLPQQTMGDRRFSNITNQPGIPNQDRVNQLKTTEKKEQFNQTPMSKKRGGKNQGMDKRYQNQNSSDEENINTPRFSDRMKEHKKETQYKQAMKKITSKRRKTEYKKQLYNSMTGKLQRQSISSNQTTEVNKIDFKYRKASGRDSSVPMAQNGGNNNYSQMSSQKHLVNSDISRISSCNSFKLNIDLRKNRL